jgi:hypothetical protein
VRTYIARLYNDFRLETKTEDVVILTYFDRKTTIGPTTM